MVEHQYLFSFYMVKALPSNAESCEEQGDGKQNFVGQTTAKLWPFCPSVAETRKRNENEIFKLC